ncbi:hypothetical protein RJ639_024676 [Escallonia herrerae]|uniref:Uncharacterized protein n=1 Tax=Escallonia herrerae TaxID=1293975 RepID=A0AA89AEZ4_9ASTE|nr:hypothetical protein RJ639_024676 [Escallonia herrerae]
MAPAPKTHLPILLLLLSFLLALTTTTAATTVYDILPEFGLPTGLLPDSVTSYTLSSDGAFTVTLPKPCYIQFDYLVYYETKITGKLKMGSITDLSGIQVQRFLFWFDVDEIRVDLPPSDSIYFQVGLINKKLDVGQFNTVHSCRASVACGQALKRSLQLPTPVEEIEMLITE